MIYKLRWTIKRARILRGNEIGSYSDATEKSTYYKFTSINSKKLFWYKSPAQQWGKYGPNVHWGVPATKRSVDGSHKTDTNRARRFLPVLDGWPQLYEPICSLFSSQAGKRSTKFSAEQNGE